MIRFRAYLQVELVVQMPVNLLGITVLPQKPPQHTKSPHPEDLGRQTGLAGTPPLTYIVHENWDLLEAELEANTFNYA